MKRIVVALCAAIVGAGAVAAVCRSDDAAAGPALRPSLAAEQPIEPARPEFPISGRWVWANGGGLLPSRDVGCRPEQAKLSIGARSILIEQGQWRHTAFAVSDWRSLGADRIRLELEDTVQAGRRRTAVLLDLSHPGFIRFGGFDTERGQEPGRRAAHLTRVSSTDDGAELDTLKGVFTLMRCADPEQTTAALLRGTLTR